LCGYLPFGEIIPYTVTKTPNIQILPLKNSLLKKKQGWHREKQYDPKPTCARK
jgi:hypothetical protein